MIGAIPPIQRGDERAIALFAFAESLFGPYAFGDIPADRLNTGNLAGRIPNDGLKHVQMPFFATGAGNLFDGLKHTASLQDILVVAESFLGELERKDIEPGLSQIFIERAAQEFKEA